MKNINRLFILIVFFLLIVGNVEAYHTTNRYGRYDDQNPKKHGDVITINNNFNIRNSVVIFDGRSRLYPTRYYRSYSYDSYKRHRYDKYSYRSYSRPRYSYYYGYDYKKPRYDYRKSRFIYTRRDSSYVY